MVLAEIWHGLGFWRNVWVIDEIGPIIIVRRWIVMVFDRPVGECPFSWSAGETVLEMVKQITVLCEVLIVTKFSYLFEGAICSVFESG